VTRTTIEIKERIPNYHYVPFHNGSRLGDIFFDRQLQSCRVRFYGWGVGISVADLELILVEIKNLEERLKNGDLNDGIDR
jgi:hypothetical protein